MKSDDTRRHESVDHVHPTDAGLMDDNGDDVPGTGILGDETIVHDLDDGKPPGIYPNSPAHTGGAAHPGPTPAAIEDEMAVRAPQQPHRHQDQTANSSRREGT